LILKVYYRAFMREGNKLRYLTEDDLWYDEKGEKTAAKAKEILIQDQPHPDHLWLTEAEGRSLMPVDPRIGDTFPMPPGIADRLVRWHLNPTVVGDGRNEPLERAAIRSATLCATRWRRSTLWRCLATSAPGASTCTTTISCRSTRRRPNAIASSRSSPALATTTASSCRWRP